MNKAEHTANLRWCPVCKWYLPTFHNDSETILTRCAITDSRHTGVNRAEGTCYRIGAFSRTYFPSLPMEVDCSFEQVLPG